MKIMDIFAGLAKNVDAHKPEVLAAAGIIGFGVSLYLMHKADKKAEQDIEEAKEELEKEDLTTQEKVKATWKTYAPVAAVTIASVACVMFSCKESLKREAAAIAAYNIVQKHYEMFAEKTKETIGESKTVKIHDAVAKDIIENDPWKEKEILETHRGNQLVYDLMFGTMFKSTKDRCELAVQKLANDMIVNTYATVNDLRYYLNLPNVEAGDDLGWDIEDGEVRAIFTVVAVPGTDMEPCLGFKVDHMPKYLRSRL